MRDQQKHRKLSLRLLLLRERKDPVVMRVSVLVWSSYVQQGSVYHVPALAAHRTWQYSINLGINVITFSLNRCTLCQLLHAHSMGIFLSDARIYCSDSMTIADAPPPPLQIPATPIFPFFSLSTPKSVVVILAPEPPSGWPSATAPP